MPARTSKKSSPKINIVAETPDYLVVAKPAGMLVHPATREMHHDSLVEELVTRYPDIAHVGDTKPWYRPGIVHRLDRDASGLLVVTRTPVMYQHLRSEFDHHRVQKTYDVLVAGTMTELEGTIDLPIARSKDLKRQITPSAGADTELIWLPAVTHWRVTHAYADTTLLEVTTETGRTQQIRVHMAAIGHPVVGDKLYGAPPNKLKRIFLHARRLAFNDQNGTLQTFELPRPVELERYLTSLK